MDPALKDPLDILISNQSSSGGDNYPTELMKVYPNPTTGITTVETNEDSPGVLVLESISIVMDNILQVFQWKATGKLSTLVHIIMECIFFNYTMELNYLGTVNLIKQ